MDIENSEASRRLHCVIGCRSVSRLSLALVGPTSFYLRLYLTLRGANINRAHHAI